jgi:hypothetical protein
VRRRRERYGSLLLMFVEAMKDKRKEKVRRKQEKKKK